MDPVKPVAPVKIEDAQLVVDALSQHVGDERREKLERVVASRLGGLVVVLEQLVDPHNGGAALRSCEANGVREVHVVGSTFGFSERVTQGCDKWLDIARDETIERCAGELKARGFKLYAAVPGAAVALEELDPLAPAAFLVGNERDGLTAAARAACDVEFAIPMHGFSQSVNLSVATALCVYTHASRRRRALGTIGDLDADARLRLLADYYWRDVRGAEAIVARARQERQS
ncbi:MAG TPA: RNA methyltransferase [Polyangia bacterium]|jgi:tRNA (guanosine-2'-O-)-methyltransferase|nr:RNA methyltransferase [Polyangia bacterium]